MTSESYAPGWPGIPPRWTSSAKSGVGTSFTHASRVWFTLSHGILNEVYYPRVDQACTRDMGLIITDGKEFFSEEKRHTHHQISSAEEGVPAYHIINTCKQGRYRTEKEIIADPKRDALLQRIQFVPLKGKLEEYHLYVLLAPHLGNRGYGNTAWVGEYKGVPMLFAERDGFSLALACSAPWLHRSVGFVGYSDGWQDLKKHKKMTWSYTHAENGNTALTGEIGLATYHGAFVLALGFGINPEEAGHRARESMIDSFDHTQQSYLQSWEAWQKQLRPMKKVVPDERDLYRISAMVMRAHEAKSFTGGIIAGLSIPWGNTKGDDDLGGYHLVWPRDLVETAVGLLAAGAHNEATRVIHYLQTTQELDGHWPQNMWLPGTPYWNGIQMDETALPILLVDQARREGALESEDLAHAWPMIRKAAAYLAQNGPVTQEDRWEVDPGYSPFTLAAEIAALLAAADLADIANEPKVGTYLRETADNWNTHIEVWTYVRNTVIDREIGVEGHYVRISPPDKPQASSPKHGYVPIKGKSPEQNKGHAIYIVGPDALALVRFGLRSAHDPRILNTIKVIDALLKVETPYGPSWRRYGDDEYGEHADGTGFNGSGIGRAWPLLTGERAHYELAAGDRDKAIKLLRAMESFADDGGMISEQIWDAADIPQKELYCGRPSGSAMPLVWAHAEYVKLRRSLHEGHVFDMPPQTIQRYLVEKTTSPHESWRFNNKRVQMEKGRTLRIEALAPALVHWSVDGWKSANNTNTYDTTLGIHYVDIPTKQLSPGSTVLFTFYWPQANKWEGTNFSITIK